ncbi:hypothetical protein PWG14_16905 (plasmid) [Chromobacterium amazonense]|uniref:hypothetical protein n=1 Tax=Chromobacterium amazonense TaxID=1382803 RepID=UPI00237EB637|nr:hypothetical protein [Chromobacterium amazonense]MDE1714210.1 hypothetical protein [Chromobacterium amazonense]
MSPKFASVWLQLLQTGLPEEKEWKGALKAWLDGNQRLSEQQQEAQWQWTQDWQQRIGAASLLDYLRQCDEVATEFSRQNLLWHLDWHASLRQQGNKLMRTLLQIRGEGDMLLAINAAAQDGRRAWDAKSEALQQALSELSPALAQNLQQWLSPLSPENAPGS